MMNAKQIADSITGCRALLALVLVWLGWARGAAGLPLAVWIMLIDWTGDSLDGTVARLSRRRYHTWQVLKARHLHGPSGPHSDHRAVLARLAPGPSL